MTTAIKTARPPSRRYREIGLQCALLYWWGLACRGLGCPHPELLLHIPNGGQRGAAAGALLAKMGVRPGVPDLFLAYPANGYSGLWLELKRDKSACLSAEQKWWQSQLPALGYAHAVARSLEEAQAAISRYLNPDPQIKLDKSTS
jgi:hypothetical protein